MREKFIIRNNKKQQLSGFQGKEHNWIDKTEQNYQPYTNWKRSSSLPTICEGLVSVPDPKPPPTRIAFSITHTCQMRSGDETSEGSKFEISAIEHMYDGAPY